MPDLEMEMIVAVAKNNVIGDSNTNRLPWHLPEDLARFYRLTNGHLVIMGHHTFQSLPHGKLKNRINVVLTNEPLLPLLPPLSETSDLYLVNLPMLWEVLSFHPDKKVFVIGGAAIYKELFRFCSIIHYTSVEIDAEGDIEFPFSRDELAIASYSIVEEPRATSAGPEATGYQYLTYYLE